MRRVVQKQKAEKRKFALAQAKARMYLVDQGKAESSGITEEQAELIRKAKEEMQRKTEETEKAMEELKKKLKEKDEALGGMQKQMKLMETSKKQDNEDEFEAAKQQAIKEVEARHAEKVKELTAGLAQRDEEMASVQKKLEAAEKAKAREAESASAAVAAHKKKLAEEAEAKVAKALQELEEKNTALESVRAELGNLRKQQATSDAQLAKMKQLAADKEALEREKQLMQLELSNLKDENAKLRRDYLAEQNLRRKYHNEVEDLKGAIRVYSRFRPLSNSEKERGNKNVCNFLDEFSVRTGPEGKERTYEYDRTFGPDSTQEDIFKETKRLVQSAVDGYNVCIFAYGQTGSGKTFTMQGASDGSAPGLTPRLCKEVFRLQRRDKGKFSFKVKFYMCELYRDNLVDLLTSSDDLVGSGAKLQIKKNPRGIVEVKGITIRTCENSDELPDLFRLDRF
jgi:hypothetical protein